MHLHRELSITEGQGPVPVKLTLAEIIKDGKVTNPYQTYVLAWLSEFFKNGLKSIDLDLESPITFGSQATSTVVQSALKAMSPEDQVMLAQYLTDCIDQGESALYNREMSVSDWSHYVLQRQN
jgi:hypothetical protein